MQKGYWIVCYREVSDPGKVAAYAQLAGPAIEAAGGRFVVRGAAAHVFEAGQLQRTVVIEFATVGQAIAAYESPAYRAALAVLDGGALRDVRIAPGAG
jgi:uncharacterized protein (DUF1330 family)